MRPEHAKRFAEAKINPAFYSSMSVDNEGPASETDIELITRALNMWANWIETGDVNISANDAQAMRKSVRPLGEDGMKLVLRLRQLADDTTNYEQFKRGLMNAPMTYCPALLKTMVETCFAKQAFRTGNIHRFVKGIEDQCELNLRTTPEPPKPDTASPTSRTTRR